MEIIKGQSARQFLGFWSGWECWHGNVVRFAESRDVGRVERVYVRGFLDVEGEDTLSVR